jgi:hypothetical protein
MGGCSYVAVGDFFQFPCVGGTPLFKYAQAYDRLKDDGVGFEKYVKNSLPNYYKAETRDAKAQEIIRAITFYRSFEDVIVLDEQKRCTDPTFNAFLERLRYAYSRVPKEEKYKIISL